MSDLVNRLREGIDFEPCGYELCSTFSVPKPEATHERNAQSLTTINNLLKE
jgi:hypothetical protein